MIVLKKQKLHLPSFKILPDEPSAGNALFINSMTSNSVTYVCDLDFAEGNESFVYSLDWTLECRILIHNYDIGIHKCCEIKDVANCMLDEVLAVKMGCSCFIF